MLIEEAIRLARELVARKPTFIAPGHGVVRITEIVSAHHQGGGDPEFTDPTIPEDYWNIIFGLDWGMPVSPDVILVQVDSKKGVATFRPVM